MRKLLLLAIAIVCVLSIKAQHRGDMRIGGSVGISSSKTNTDVGDEIILEDKSFRFNVSPSFYYFIDDHWALGGSLGYSFSKCLNDNGDMDDKLYDKNKDFGIRPEVIYYMDLGKNFYYTPSAYIAVGFGKTIVEKTEKLKKSNTNNWFELGVILLSFEYKFTKNWALSFSCGGLGYEYNKSGIDKSEDRKISSFDFNIRLNPALGFGYYF